MSPPRQISHLLGTLLLVAATPCIAQTRCDAPRNPVFAKYEKLDVTDGWFEVYRLEYMLCSSLVKRNRFSRI